MCFFGLGFGVGLVLCAEMDETTPEGIDLVFEEVVVGVSEDEGSQEIVDDGEGDDVLLV